MVAPGRGQGEWAAALYAVHAPNLLRYLAARVGPAVAEDLTAETFIVAIRRQESFDPARGSAGGWLFGIASNVLRQHHRSQARYWQALTRAGMQQGLPDGDPHGDDVVGRVDAQAAVRRLVPHLLDLSGVDRDILLLTAWAGLGPAEVAEALGMRPPQVRSHLHRLRRRLRAAAPLGEPGQSAAPDLIDHVPGGTRHA